MADSPTIHVQILLFSHLKSALSQDQLSLELAAGATTDDLMAHLHRLLPESVRQIPVRVAVNQVYEPKSIVLKDGDEVALIPPVQGG